jgi:hypothetical protein
MALQQANVPSVRGLRDSKQRPSRSCIGIHLAIIFEIKNNPNRDRKDLMNRDRIQIDFKHIGCPYRLCVAADFLRRHSRRRRGRSLTTVAQKPSLEIEQVLLITLSGPLN